MKITVSGCAQRASGSWVHSISRYRRIDDLDPILCTRHFCIHQIMRTDQECRSVHYRQNLSKQQGTAELPAARNKSYILCSITCERSTRWLQPGLKICCRMKLWSSRVKCSFPHCLLCIITDLNLYADSQAAMHAMTKTWYRSETIQSYNIG